MLLTQFDKDGNGELDLEEFSCFFAEAQARSVTTAPYVFVSVCLYLPVFSICLLLYASESLYFHSLYLFPPEPLKRRER